MIQLPENLEAEQQLLGAVILDNGRAKSAAMAQVVPSDFFNQSHQLIFEAMQALTEKGMGIDFVTLGNELDEKGHSVLCGGDSYLFDLASACGVPGHYNDYIRIIKEKSLARRVLQEAIDAVEGSDYEVIATMATKLGIDHSVMPIKSVCMANATEEEPEYVFDPFFPRKQVTDLSGPENAGKTRFLIAFVSWLSRGMNPQGGGHPPISVLFVTTEDSPSVLRFGPIEEYGGDLKRFHFYPECGALTSGVLSAIAARARELKVDIVVFDPIMEIGRAHV